MIGSASLTEPLASPVPWISWLSSPSMMALGVSMLSLPSTFVPCGGAALPPRPYLRFFVFLFLGPLLFGLFLCPVTALILELPGFG
jgi:hypothetical protein